MNKILILFFIVFICSGFSFSDDIKRDPTIDKKKKVQKTLKLINGIRGKALSTLLKLEKKYGRRKNKKHGEILIRIAELYYEKAKSVEATEVKRFDAAVAGYHKTRKGREPVLNNSGSRNYLYKSINTYMKFIKIYPEHGMLDKAYFNLAFNYKELGREEKAVTYFHTLIHKRPSSPLIPDAYLNIAEYHFHISNLDEARYNYEKVVEFENTNIYGYALYKLGWTYFNLKDYPSALKHLERVVSYGRSSASNFSNKRIELIKESLKDIVFFYSESGDRSKAKDYFFKVGGKNDYIWMMERLSEIYIDNGDHINAIATYKDLINIDRYGRKNPSWTLSIVDSYKTINNVSAMLKYLDTLIITYKRDSDWYDFHKKDKKILNEVYELREKALRSYATTYHALARKEHRALHYDITGELYSKYLNFFPDDKNSYKLRFYYAEMFFETRKFLSSAREYALVRDDTRSSEHLEKSAFNVIYSYDMKIKDYEYILASNTEKNRKLLRKIKAVEKRQITACDGYIKKVPGGKEIINIKFKAARLLYKHKDYVAARPRFAHIVDKYPSHKNAVFSVHLMLDSFNIEKNWKELNKWARKFYANEILVKHGKLSDELYALIIDSSFKICLDYEKEKKYKLAADKFNEFSLEFPDHTLAKEAILNSARNYENDDKLYFAIEMHRKFTKKYPKAGEIKNVYKSLAMNYEKIGYLAIASAYYEKFVEVFPNDPETEKAQFNIAYFKDLAANYDEAEKNYLLFLKKYPRSKYCPEAIDLLVNIYRNSGNTEKEKAFLKMYISATGTNKDRVVASQLRLGKLASEKKRYREANSNYRNAITYYSKNGKKDFLVGEKYVAEAQFLLADMQYAKFSSIKLSLPRAKMIKQITQKMKIMKSMNKNYSKVFDYGPTEFAIAALYKIGLSYEELSKALFNAPMPKSLTTKEIQAFKAELEEIAYPIEEKAISSFEADIEKAEEFKLGMKWAKLAYEKMNKYKPRDYPPDIMERELSFIESGTLYRVN